MVSIPLIETARSGRILDCSEGEIVVSFAHLSFSACVADLSCNTLPLPVPCASNCYRSRVRDYRRGVGRYVGGGTGTEAGDEASSSDWRPPSKDETVRDEVIWA
jgi:hypothetical protein